ncbi:MAG: hypothetical protein R6V62_01595 [Candidatus Fermentibacteraceae bacterium]
MVRRLLAFSAVLLLGLACASGYTGTIRPVVGMLDSYQPQQAMVRLRQVFPDSTGRDRLLYLMELGNLARYAGVHQVARAALLRAESLSDNQRGTAFDQEAAALLTSDLAREFRGADYEKVFINYALAASFASTGDYENALVEARRVNQKLRVYNSDYGENPNRYIDDAFIRYFMGILYEADGELSDALVSYRLALQIYEGDYARSYGVPVPERLKADLLRLAEATGYESLLSEYRERWPGLDTGNTAPGSGMGEIVIVLEAGSIATRYEESYPVITDDRVFNISLPAISERPRRYLTAAAEVAGNREQFFLVQDMNALARQNLLDHAGRDVLRAAARTLVKAGVSELGEEIAEEASGDSRVGDAVGLVLSIVGAVTDRADLRAWLTIPAQIHVARVRVPGGTWPLNITVNGRASTHTPVQVDPGETVFVFVRQSL